MDQVRGRRRPWIASQLASGCNADARGHIKARPMLPQSKRPGFSRCLHLHYIMHECESRMGRGRPTWLDVQHHLHRLLPEGNHGVQARQVEIIFDKVFRYFTKVLVAG